MYKDGRGVVQDDIQAVFWFRKSAEQGDYLAEMLIEKLEQKIKNKNEFS